MLDKLKKEIKNDFIEKYCVKRPTQKVRWLRGVFYDDTDQLEKIFKALNESAEKAYSKGREETLRDVKIEIQELANNVPPNLLLNEIINKI